MLSYVRMLLTQITLLRSVCIVCTLGAYVCVRALCMYAFSECLMCAYVVLCVRVCIAYVMYVCACMYVCRLRYVCLLRIYVCYV